MMRAWLVPVLLLGAALPAAEEGFAVPADFALPSRPRPWIAATPEELARIRDLAKMGTEAPKPVSTLVARARDILTNALFFPPRGGGHNQNYQCPKHPIGLVTVDLSHHRCPIDGQIFSGAPFDDVVYTKIHNQNLADVVTCAWAWRLTGENAFLERARATLEGYAERYEGYELHANKHGNPPTGSSAKLFSQTLDEGVAGIAIGTAFDLVETGLDASTRDEIRSGLLRPMVKTIQRAKAGKGNWQSYHNAGLIHLAACLEDVPLLRATIEDPAQGFLFQMGASITEEGMWYESSWAYHYYTFTALASHAEAARRLGIDLWRCEPLRRMAALPARYAMPDGRLPRFGDGSGMAVLSSQPSVEAAAAATEDPRILSILPEDPDFTGALLGRSAAPKSTTRPLFSEVLPGAGHLFLRGPAPAGLTTAVTFGPDGGYHGHFDKLGFVFYGFGREIGVDPGSAKSQAYSLPIHSLWYRASLSHNVVLVDRLSQNPCQGKLDFFVTNALYAAAGVSCDDAYSNVRWSRVFLQTSERLLVHDELESIDGSPRDFTWLFHGMGSEVESAGLQASSTPPNWPGMEFAKDVRTATGKKDLRFDFSGATPLRLVMNEEGSDVVCANGPLGSILERVPFVAVTRSGAKATFTSCLEPVAPGQSPRIRSLSAEREGGDLVFTVSLEDRTRTWRVNAPR